MTNLLNFPDSLIESTKECKTPEELAILIKLADRTVFEDKDQLTITAHFIQKSEELKDSVIKTKSFNYANKHGFLNPQ